MSVLGRRAAQVEHELGAEWTRYHVGAQATRFIVGVLTTLLWSMHAGFTDWTDLLPLLGTAAWTTAEQMWPRVPWKLLQDRFGVEAPAAVPPAPAPPSPADPVPPAKG